MYEQKIAELDQRVGRIEESFPKDVKGNPKFYEHRQYHTKEDREEELISDIKDKAIKQIAFWALSLILAALAVYMRYRP